MAAAVRRPALPPVPAGATTDEHAGRPHERRPRPAAVQSWCHSSPSYRTASAVAARMVEDPVTTAEPPDNADPEVTTRVIDGQVCTNRTGVAHLAGWKPGQSVTVRARTDPDFPHGTKQGREFWYPFDGPHGVNTYLEVLARRAQDKKPAPVEPGNPDDQLHGEDAAAALHITYATLRHYIRLSQPYWTGAKQGRPILPRPDFQEEREHDRFGPYTYREWLRSTLAAHQEGRPGPGTGAGRPARTEMTPAAGHLAAATGHTDSSAP